MLFSFSGFRKGLRLSLVPAFLCYILVTATNGYGFTLVAPQTDWRFKPGTEEASQPDTAAWRLGTFDDSAWLVRAGTFVYGEPGFSGTDLSGMQGDHTSIFLRREFVITNAAMIRTLSLRAVCDDGFIAWINGVEVASANRPSGEPRYDSVSGGLASEPQQYGVYPLAKPSTYLVSGHNILAVQVFNRSLSSSDLVFDAELSAESWPDLPIRVDSVLPAPGPVGELTQIEVFFSEPVTGVTPGDLRINGTGAISVEGAEAHYLFTFAPPAFGTVDIAWDLASGIQASLPPERWLDPRSPGMTWSYQLIDVSAPTVASRHPVPGVTVRRLEYVEVTFDRAVQGVDASDLLINDQAAHQVVGGGVGPYRFELPELSPGAVQIAWIADSGIVTVGLATNTFEGGSWQVTLAPSSALPRVRISEFLADNVAGLDDEDGYGADWIELHNEGEQVVELAGWSLTDDAARPGKWVFPACTLNPGERRLVFASGKDRRNELAGSRLHTNFKLNATGEALQLWSADAPRALVDGYVSFPRQRPDYSYGLADDGQFAYFRDPSPELANGLSAITNSVGEVHFSAPSCLLSSSARIALTTQTPGAVIRYTTDGSVPTETTGSIYTEPVAVSETPIRAVAFKENHLPSEVGTRTYLLHKPPGFASLPILSVVTAPDNLYGVNGIMEKSPRNTTQHGIAWERPAAVELILPDGKSAFKVDCGLRLAGGDYIRGQYDYEAPDPPFNKYSFRLYFRGDYGASRLKYPFFEQTTVDSFDTVTLRAGMNDPTNPFLKDELVRELCSDVGQVACHGTFVHLYLNGRYRGYYNPCERVDDDFLQTYHGGEGEWDIVDHANQVKEGDRAAWDNLKWFVGNHDLSDPSNYLQLETRLDVTNYVDYLLPLIYVDNDDWPHNNWRAARKREPGGLWRFYAWDAEWAFGYQNGVANNTIEDQLSTLNPPWGSTDFQRMFNAIKGVPEFQMLFADRVHKHMFNGGALTDERIRERYEGLKHRILPAVSGFNDAIGEVWIPQRRNYVLSHLNNAGFLASETAPVITPFGGLLAPDETVTLSSPSRTIYYTTNGADPRIRFSGAVSPDAQTYLAPLTFSQGATVRARSYGGGQWSALTEVVFQVGVVGHPVRITELMYHPTGGDAYEYIELRNLGVVAVDLSDYSFSGVDLRFVRGAASVPGLQSVIVASDRDPQAFGVRYPGVQPVGYFSGALSNGGETVALLAPDGTIVSSVTYDDERGWPTEPDGLGFSLERIDPSAYGDDPGNWQSSGRVFGSPGEINGPRPEQAIRINEVMAVNMGSVSHEGTYPDWVELHNPSTETVSIGGWSLSDSGDARKFVIPNGTSIPGQGYGVIWFDSALELSGLHSGFGLGQEGETLALYDAATNRVDVVMFGPQIADYSLGRWGESSHWHLTEPSPGGENEPAVLAKPDVVRINELLANPLAGDADWIELHNTHSVLPVSLEGVRFTVAGTSVDYGERAFIAPGGYQILRATGDLGRDELDLKCPAAGATLQISFGPGLEPIDSVTYPPQSENVTSGRLPDGSGPWTPFPLSPSPGTTNYSVTIEWSGPVITEFMARNQTAFIDSYGATSDWLEIHNPQPVSVDLTGHALAIGPALDDHWVFPSGAIIESGAYWWIWCASTRAGSTAMGPGLNTGFALPGEGGRIVLLDPAGMEVQSLPYGFQLVDRSVAVMDGEWGLATQSTPGAANDFPPEAAGDARLVRINEWSSNSPNGEDWFELYNGRPTPAGLAGLVLTDDPSLLGSTKFTIPPLTFIDGHGYIRWLADGQAMAGPDHVNFSLDERGEMIRFATDYQRAFDTVYFNDQQPGESRGRFPDGSAAMETFTASISPGESNYLPLTNVVINEVLTHTDPPLEDAVELVNLTDAPIEIGGWYLSNDSLNLTKFPIPAEATLAPQGFLVLYESAFNDGAANAFALNSAHGGHLYLSATDSEGQPNGYRSVFRFGALENGRSMGRVPTSTGMDVAPLALRTFGVDQPASVADFRLGVGMTNSAPFISEIIISELMYHAVVRAGVDATDAPGLEYVEIHNRSDQELPLYDPQFSVNTWQLGGGITYAFPGGTALPPHSSVLVVPFDPVLETELLSLFRDFYALDNTVPVLGPYRGQLNNAGEEILLMRPDRPQGPGQPDEGFVPYIAADRVNYDDASPWPVWADGYGYSLQRRMPNTYGNDPGNWLAAAATPGWVDDGLTTQDSDGDGLPDEWEERFGLNSGYAADRDEDADADGLSNGDEFLAGTNPRDPQSVLSLQLTWADGNQTLRFVAHPGRGYAMDYRDSISEGTWIRWVDIEPAGRDEWVSVVVDEPRLEGHRYYRLVITELP